MVSLDFALPLLVCFLYDLTPPLLFLPARRGGMSYQLRFPSFVIALVVGPEGLPLEFSRTPPSPFGRCASRRRGGMVDGSLALGLLAEIRVQSHNTPFSAPRASRERTSSRQHWLRFLYLVPDTLVFAEHLPVLPFPWAPDSFSMCGSASSLQ